MYRRLTCIAVLVAAFGCGDSDLEEMQQAFNEITGGEPEVTEEAGPEPEPPAPAVDFDEAAASVRALVDETVTKKGEHLAAGPETGKREEFTKILYLSWTAAEFEPVFDANGGKASVSYRVEGRRAPVFATLGEAEAFPLHLQNGEPFRATYRVLFRLAEGRWVVAARTWEYRLLKGYKAIGARRTADEGTPHDDFLNWLLTPAVTNQPNLLPEAEANSGESVEEAPVESSDDASGAGEPATAVE